MKTTDEELQIELFSNTEPIQNIYSKKENRAILGEMRRGRKFNE